MLNEEQYLLICLMEECDEVSQRAAKALRFGLNEAQPGQDLTNAARITQEINDLFTVIERIENLGMIPATLDAMAINAKHLKITKYMAYSREQGTLEAA